MPHVLRWLYRRFGGRYFLFYLAFDVLSAMVICLATVGLFALYEDTSFDDILEITLVSEAAVLAAVAFGTARGKRMVRPLLEWIEGPHRPELTVEAWRSAVSLPRRFVVENGWQPFAVVAVAIAVYVALRFDLPAYGGAIVLAVSLLAIAYAAVLHFFASETFLRPVLEDVSSQLPADFGGQAVGVPLRWKLLGSLPIINVITGVVVSGLSTDGRSSLDELGLDVVVALAVAFTISLELTVLVAKSVLRPVDDLLEATGRVKRGELDARVPVVSADELGTLAASFNEMMQGLSERQALRDALGAYVDPDVAERVLEEGELLEGRAVEVTVLFVDIRDFTPFAERSTASETVAFLNEFFEVVVPIVLKHRGHANKFLGDGLLAVFGVPERLPAHADRALAAAKEVATEVERRFHGEVEIGIGVNSGPVVVGSVGGGGRLEFTVIGDPVNVAARVQAATRERGDTILVTEASRRLLETSGAELAPRGQITVKGKSDSVRIYAAPILDERSIPDARRLTAEA